MRFVLVFLLFFTVLSCNNKNSDKDKKLDNSKKDSILKDKGFKKALELYENKNYKTSYKIFLDLLKKYPDNVKINYYLGSIAAKSYNLPLAEKYLLKVIKYDKTEWRAYRDLAILYKSLYKYKKALKFVKEVFKYKKDDPESNFIMAYLSNKLEHNDKAYIYYERAVKYTSTYMLAYLHYGEFYFSRKQYEKAERVWLEGLNKRYSATIAQRLGNMYMKLKKYDKALKIFNELKKRYPTGIETDFYIAKIYELKKDYRKAVELYEAIIKKNNNYDSPKIALGELYVKLKKYKKALGLYSQLDKKYSYKTTFYLYKTGEVAKLSNDKELLKSVMEKLKKSNKKESKDYLKLLLNN